MVIWVDYVDFWPILNPTQIIILSKGSKIERKLVIKRELGRICEVVYGKTLTQI